MSLNIKKEEPHRLARELAQFAGETMAGETMAGVITVALKKRIEREKRERKHRRAPP